MINTKETIPVRNPLPAIALLMGLAGPAMAGDDLPPALSYEQAMVAGLISAGMFAADRCPGFHLVWPAIRSAADSVGVTEAQALGPEWSNAMLLAAVDTKKLFEKDPVGFCDSAWRILGPDHKGSMPTLLTKD
jgi:hypothetical protein